MGSNNGMQPWGKSFITFARPTHQAIYRTLLVDSLQIVTTPQTAIIREDTRDCVGQEQYGRQFTIRLESLLLSGSLTLGPVSSFVFVFSIYLFSCLMLLFFSPLSIIHFFSPCSFCSLFHCPLSVFFFFAFFFFSSFLFSCDR